MGAGDILVERVVFNAITKNAVTTAMEHPRAIDAELVDAYLARRALDYLVGFNLSPVLWRKLPGSRSAGRVQSVALRIVCDRENEIESFRAQEYWNIVAQLRAPDGTAFEARLHSLDGETLKKFTLGNQGDANRALISKLANLKTAIPLQRGSAHRVRQAQRRTACSKDHRLNLRLLRPV